MFFECREQIWKIVSSLFLPSFNYAEYLKLLQISSRELLVYVGQSDMTWPEYQGTKIETWTFYTLSFISLHSRYVRNTHLSNNATLAFTDERRALAFLEAVHLDIFIHCPYILSQGHTDEASSHKQSPVHQRIPYRWSQSPAQFAASLPLNFQFCCHQALCPRCRDI